MRAALPREAREEMLAAYIAGSKTAGQLARKYGVSESYPRWLAWARRNPRGAKRRWVRRTP
jgi:transposase-like protein